MHYVHLNTLLPGLRVNYISDIVVFTYEIFTILTTYNIDLSQTCKTAAITRDSYCIAQNFGGANFWQMKLENAFGW